MKKHLSGQTDLPALRRSVAKALAEAGIETASADADILVGSALGLSRARILSENVAVVGADAGARLDQFVERRRRREPVSRILGQRSFWTMDLAINEHVLDPRPDSETLVEVAASLFAERRHDHLRILDLGTGSGALLCALLVEFPEASGLGVDICADACDVANGNLKACGLAGRGVAQHGDWFTGLSGRFDLVVSNPPYIATPVLAGLAPEVRDWDPVLALDGGRDGLAAYRLLAQQAAGFVERDGALVLEIGFDQGEAVSELIARAGFAEIALHKDLAGNPRVAAGRVRGQA